MTFVVRELPKAKDDKRSIFTWLSARSAAGAEAWLSAYDELLGRLSRDANSFGEAPESHDCEFPIRQALFKTRRGRVYRVIYFVERTDVFVLRVRGPGQAPISPTEMR